MPTIGVSELHRNASKVLRDTREHGTMYVITKRDKTVATILPLRPAEQGVGADSTCDDRAWDHFWEVSERIRGSWKSPLPDQDIMREIRR